MSTQLLLSLIINVVLLIALFLKPALNEIFVGWWKQKVKKKEELKQFLVDFRSNINDFSQSLRFYHGGLYAVEFGQGTSETFDVFKKEIIEPGGQKTKMLKKDLFKKNVLCPQSIQPLVKSLISKDDFSKLEEKAKKVSPREGIQIFLAYDREISDLANKIITEIEKLL